MRWSCPVSLKTPYWQYHRYYIWYRCSFTQAKNVMKYTFGTAPILVINEDIVFLIEHNF